MANDYFDISMLKGKTALITGASKGIGLAIAVAYAQKGCDLILVSRDERKLAANANQLTKSYGVKVQWHACDLTNHQKVVEMVNMAEDFKAIDILVNNAGILKGNSFLEYSMSDFKDVFDTNVFGVVGLSQAVLKKMISRRSGRVINIASTAGKWGSKNQSAYNMSKHAIVGLTRCLALEMAGNSITVNAICPWVVETDMAGNYLKNQAKNSGRSYDEVMSLLQSSAPIGRLVKPEEVASLAVYIASEESGSITGQSWTVDGGYTMI